jgi:hypothetical protein
MAVHQHDPAALELWLYFKKVIDWVDGLFPNYRKEMKGLDWGVLYNAHKDDAHDPKLLEKRVVELMQDEDVTKKSGIYAYLLTGEKRHLNIRAFTDNMRREAYERQKGICPQCGKDKRYELGEMDADHITPWHEGGKTSAENCQMLCIRHNREKSGK